jgi:short-subunit dehydrogenase
MELGAGTRVLVTGASRGIGEAIARAFAARGCTLGLVARCRERLDQLAASLPGTGHRALEGDVGDAASIGGAVREFGKVDVLVANAGVTHYMPFAELPLEKAEEMDRVNWLGTLYTLKAALPGMLERRSGHIVVISSGGGVRGFPSAAVYNGTKAAQRGFAEALRHELRACPSRPFTRSRSRPHCTTTRSTACPTGTTSTGARRPAPSPRRSSRRWSTTGARSSTRRSCGCFGS